MRHDDLKKLAAPFDPAKVHWRVGQVTKKDPRKASALCYIDARDVMERLDEVCGPGDWQDEYTVHGPRVICTIRIKVGDEWVGKSDGAGDTAVEGEKGGISDAFKRAAVKWGVGRYLYDIPMQWVAIDEWKKILPSEATKLQRALPGSRVDVSTTKDEAPTATEDPAVAEWRNWVETFLSDLKHCPTVEAVNELAEGARKELEALQAFNNKTYGFVLKQLDQRRHIIAQAPGRAA